ncbi:ABC transporter substrate-binding protein [Streptomyces indicus]|uniref:ABC-type branched-chain amino acid transport system, substrate-binding protein n=1 Tax=Streptomyces indicus TaxID=417292 RepID=A0A1G9HS37_9ACTN|nr:ABC transporter substrate-binding protein [Streptomyces indicus]SDL15758.1 ABC-type branched-chain amino acid transport system, substrate-binding protein [Streptomyces indicus]
MTPRPPRLRLRSSAARSAAALVAAASLTAGCGAIPGLSSDSEEPVTVMTWAPENTKSTNAPGVPAMAQAYARWVNANGGLNGRELKVITCNEHNKVSGAADCARRAVDAEVTAVVGSYSQYGRSFLSALEAEGIPFIGGFGLTDDEFTSPLSYPVNGGQVALMAGNGRQLAEHCQRVSLVRPDTIAGDDLPELLDYSLKQAGRPAAADIRAKEDANDFAAQAAKALEAAGAPESLATTLGVEGAREQARKGCVTAALGDRTATFFDSFRREREDFQEVRVGSVAGSIDQTAINRGGGKSGVYEGAYFTGWYPAAGDARWEPMRKVISEHAFNDNRIDPADASVQNTWIAYTVLKQVVESLGDGTVDADAVTQALNDGLRVKTGGLTPTLSWRFEDTIAVRDYPRMVNAHVWFQQVRGGQLQAVGGTSVDMSETLEQTI